MKIRGKKGTELLSNESVSLGLSVLALIVLFLLSVAIYNAFFDSSDETAKSYMDSLENELSNARNEGSGEFFIWNIASRETESEYYLVYFGGRLALAYEEIDFISNGKENTACICLVESGKSFCNICQSFDRELELEGIGDEFVISKGSRYTINYEGSKYVFREI